MTQSKLNLERPIHIRCPNCNANFEVSGDSLNAPQNHQITCPNCNHRWLSDFVSLPPEHPNWEGNIG